jgi:hypothetical protein
MFLQQTIYWSFSIPKIILIIAKTIQKTAAQKNHHVENQATKLSVNKIINTEMINDTSHRVIRFRGIVKK